jgi:hypothetical protein
MSKEFYQLYKRNIVSEGNSEVEVVETLKLEKVGMVTE